jgi:hypothetical protein
MMLFSSQTIDLMSLSFHVTFCWTKEIDCLIRP